MDLLDKVLSFLNPTKNASFIQALGSVLVVLTTLTAVVKAVIAVLTQQPLDPAP
jgi:hypothetical protein